MRIIMNLIRQRRFYVKPGKATTVKPRQSQFAHLLQKEPLRPTDLYKRYPLDDLFIQQITWLCKGILSCNDRKSTPVSPIVRLKHPTVAGQEMQKKIAQVIASQLQAHFMVITKSLLEQVEIDCLNDRSGEMNEQLKVNDINPMTLSAIMALQKQEIVAGLYPISDPRRKRGEAPSDFFMFTIPAIQYILDAVGTDGPLVLYMPEIDEVVTSSRDRKLLGEFLENHNRANQRLTLLIAPSYTDSECQPTTMKNEEGYKVDHLPTTAIADKFGPLWQPLPSSISIHDRSLHISIPKPSDARRALCLRHALRRDEQDLLFRKNLESLKDLMAKFDFPFELKSDGELAEFRQRLQSKSELVRVALTAKGLAGDGAITMDAIDKVLAQRPSSDVAGGDDGGLSRFASTLQIDQLNNYEKHLLKTCVATPGTLALTHAGRHDRDQV